MEFRKILSERGWYMFHKCSCKGTPQEDYRRQSGDKTVIVTVFPQRNNFQVKKFGRIVLRTDLVNISEELNKI